MASTIIDLGALDGADGFRLDGPDVNVRAGSALAAAGDFNADGFRDIAIGASLDPSGDGGVFVVFGKANGFAGALDLDSLDGADGTEILTPINGITFGFSVASGDFNGDGASDILSGAPNLNNGGLIGGAFLAAGSAGFADATLSLAALDGADGVRFEGVDANDRAGRDLAGLGDFNGDGLGDLLIGGAYADIAADGNEGESYIVFGRQGGFDPTVALGDLDGTDGIRLDGFEDGSFSGRFVGEVGDMNGDGLAEAAIASTGTTDEGDVFIVFGRGDGVAEIDLEDLDGVDGFRFDGSADRDYAGRSVAGAGDINGDGFGDLVIGAFGADVAAPVAGQTYVLFGTDASFDATLDRDDLDGADGFVIDGVDSRDKLGSGVSSAGDFNGDGLDDLLVFAREADFGSGGDRGEAYVLFGRTTGFAQTLDIGTLDATEGVRIQGVDAYDFQLAVDTAKGLGDVNGDGFDDIVLGGPYDDPASGQNAGSSYVVFGGDFAGLVTQQGTAAGETVIGNGQANVMALGQGDDIFNAGGGDDVVRGGEGRDTGSLGGGDDRGFGGAGDDILNGSLGDDVLYGGDGTDRLTLGFGADAAFGGAGTDLIFERANQLKAGDRIDGGEGQNDTLVILSTGALDLTALDLFAGIERVRVAANQQITSTDDDINWTGRAGAETYGLGDGRDIVRAGGGDDVILGGGGNDTLLAQGGDDRIQGGAGIDRIVGAGGSDTFVFAAGMQIDVIFDFENGVDLLDVSAFGFTDFATEIDPGIRTVNGKAVIDFAPGERLILSGVAEGDLDAADFVFAS